MGFFGKIGKVLNKVKTPLAVMAGNALLPGIGGAIGGAIAGGVGNGKPKLGKILGGAASGAIGAGVLSKAGSVGNLASKVVGGGGGATGGATSTLGKIGNFADKYGGTILGGIGAIQGAKQQGQADKYAKEALALSRERDAANAPLRDQGRDAMLGSLNAPARIPGRNDPNPFAANFGPMLEPDRSLRPLSPTQGGETPPGPQAVNPRLRPLRDISQPNIRY